ncbi:VCBS repeat-containing protein [Parasedimentitalea psychrophila]|uniref:VCBS repeat-containing protein n=1 Tax=Parasedimentitalea psychrophila TaxID=2997337 RepID=A0A9Y2P534_9RHOB|nr:VCBS repeat-containing protein [Parasedimentitalea psychrophila]WIY23568.1 VCBS repeat-containing protein [Parasedimentitalea psychrophila]
MFIPGEVARRLLPRPWPGPTRHALRLLRLWLGGLVLMAASMAQATPPDVIVSARFIEPTTRYDHAILGDDVEWGALELLVDACSGCDGSVAYRLIIRLPETHVFEDLEPRIIEGDDGPTLVMVVESSLTQGARLSLYDERGLYAATPFIGRPHRWLAPIGSADLDGDGWPEVAYIDRPHLAKTLRIWSLRDGELVEVASKTGLTNHRIGEDFITSGIRDCGDGPEVVTVDSGWSRIVASTLGAGEISSRDIGAFEGRGSMDRALDCR